MAVTLKLLQTASARHNVFMPPVSKLPRLELGLLALPILAICLMLALLPHYHARAIQPEKVTLRVTSIVPRPDPELEREMKLVRQQMRFALSKVASESQVRHALAIAQAAPADPDGRFNGRMVDAPKVARQIPIRQAGVNISSRRRVARSPRDIRPENLKASVQFASSRKTQ